MEPHYKAGLCVCVSWVLMVLCLLPNCCALAVRLHVNGSTCRGKLHRGTMVLTAATIYLGHHMSICMF